MAVSRSIGITKPPATKNWLDFEKQVETAVRQLGGAVVRRNVKILGTISGRRRQIDVVATAKVAGHEMKVIFEAKRYGSRVQIGTIDELVGKALDVGAQRAVLYSAAGFSAGATARADGTVGHTLTIGTVHLPDAKPGVVTPARKKAASRQPGSRTTGDVLRREPPPQVYRLIKA